MAAVALIALCLTAAKRLPERQMRFEINSILHGMDEGTDRYALAYGEYPPYGGCFGVSLEPAPRPPSPAVLVRRIAHHRRLRIKYEFASKVPWLPVLADPPEPK